MNKYYVYEHIRLDTNEVFYVGKGCGNRAYDKNNRSIEWNEIISDIEYKINIVQDNMEENDAYILENQLIFEYGFMIEGGILINRQFNNFRYGDLIEYDKLIDHRKPTSVIRVPIELHKLIKETAKNSGFTSMVAFLTHLLKNYNKGE